MKFDSNNRRSSVSTHCNISKALVDSTIAGEIVLFSGLREFDEGAPQSTAGETPPNPSPTISTDSNQFGSQNNLEN